jgi:hypothetical protein
VELIGSNMFFVNNKYLKNLGIKETNPEIMYQPPQFGELASGPAVNGRGYN